MIVNLFKRWKEVKALINSDEYFLVTAKQEDCVEPWRGPIKYEYMNNTDRDLFYKFVKDHLNDIKE